MLEKMRNHQRTRLQALSLTAGPWVNGTVSKFISLGGKGVCLASIIMFQIASAQAEVVAESASEAEDFFETVVRQWSDVLLNAPLKMGRARIGSGGTSYTEFMYAKDHSVSVYNDGNGGGHSSFSNPEYYCSVSHGPAGNTVNDIQSGELPKVGWRLSPFYSTSVIGSFDIPTLVEKGHLKVVKIERGNTTKIWFTPDDGQQMEIDEAVVEFDDRYHLPVSIQKKLSGTDVIIKTQILDFIEIEGYLLPRLVRGMNSSQGSGSFDFRVQYFPHEQLDTKRCYVEYYGLSTPNFQVAEKTSHWILSHWLALLGAVGSGIGIVVFFFCRNSDG